MGQIPRSIERISSCNKIFRGFRSTGVIIPVYPLTFAGYRYSIALTTLYSERASPVGC